MSGSQGNGSWLSIADGGSSLAYTLSEIEEAGSRLSQLAQRMDPLVDRLRSECNWLGQAAAGAVPYPATALSGMDAALRACMRARAGLGEFGRRSASAAANYAEVESRTARQFLLDQALSKALPGPLRLALEFKLMGANHGSEGSQKSMERLLRAGPNVLAMALGPGAAAMFWLSRVAKVQQGQPSDHPAFGLRKFTDATGISRPGRLVVREVPSAEWQPDRAPFMPPGHAANEAGAEIELAASFEGMLDGTRVTYNHPPGSISVIRVDRADGTAAWVVNLPGTEDWSTFDSSNPFDMEGNIEGLTAARSQEYEQQFTMVQQLIKDALQAAGALPGEDVLLTGHSGGGIQAAAAAADPAFLAEVNVKMIVIAGAPGGEAQIGKDVAVMGLENERDIVTTLDLRPPPASDNWVTVTTHRLPESYGNGPMEVLANAHSIDNYVRDAAMLDQSSAPSIVAQREKLTQLLGVGTGGALVAGRKWVFQGKDAAVAPPLPGQSAKGAKEGGKEDRYKQGIR